MRKKKLLKQFQELPGELEIIRQNSGAAGVNLEVPCGISMVCLESWMYSQSRFAICVSVLQGKEYSLETAKGKIKEVVDSFGLSMCLDHLILFSEQNPVSQ